MAAKRQLDRLEEKKWKKTNVWDSSKRRQSTRPNDIQTNGNVRVGPMHWSYAQIIFSAGFAGHGGLDKDAAMARWS